MLHRGVIPASRGGKLKTLVQAIAIGLFILPLQGWPAIWTTVAWWVMGAAIVLTVLTGVDYAMPCAVNIVIGAISGGEVSSADSART